LGFGEREAHAALTRVLQDEETSHELDAVLRRSLQLLTERAYSSAC
jgi:hypothetical protein